METESETVALEPVLYGAAAARLADALGGRRGRDVVLDGAAVQRLGAQCLQVLLAARVAWAGDGRRLALRAVSEELAAGLMLMGAGQGWDGWAMEQVR